MLSFIQLFVVLSWKLSTKDGYGGVISMKRLKMRLEFDQGKAKISYSFICHSDAHDLRLKQAREGARREWDKYSK